MFDDWWNSYYDKLFYIADVDDLDVVMMIIDLTMSAMMTGIRF